MILLVAQLIMQNCPTFYHDLAPPLDGAPRRSRGSRGIVTPLCQGTSRGTDSVQFNHKKELESNSKSLLKFFVCQLACTRYRECI